MNQETFKKIKTFQPPDHLKLINTGYLDIYDTIFTFFKVDDESIVVSICNI